MYQSAYYPKILYQGGRSPNSKIDETAYLNNGMYKNGYPYYPEYTGEEDGLGYRCLKGCSKVSCLPSSSCSTTSKGLCALLTFILLFIVVAIVTGLTPVYIASLNSLKSGQLQTTKLPEPTQPLSLDIKNGFQLTNPGIAAILARPEQARSLQQNLTLASSLSLLTSQLNENTKPKLGSEFDKIYNVRFFLNKDNNAINVSYTVRSRPLTNSEGSAIKSKVLAGVNSPNVYDSVNLDGNTNLISQQVTNDAISEPVIGDISIKKSALTSVLIEEPEEPEGLKDADNNRGDKKTALKGGHHSHSHSHGHSHSREYKSSKEYNDLKYGALNYNPSQVQDYNNQQSQQTYNNQQPQQQYNNQPQQQYSNNYQPQTGYQQSQSQNYPQNYPQNYQQANSNYQQPNYQMANSYNAPYQAPTEAPTTKAAKSGIANKIFKKIKFPSKSAASGGKTGLLAINGRDPSRLILRRLRRVRRVRNRLIRRFLRRRRRHSSEEFRHSPSIRIRIVPKGLLDILKRRTTTKAPETTQQNYYPMPQQYGSAIGGGGYNQPSYYETATTTTTKAPKNMRKLRVNIKFNRKSEERPKRRRFRNKSFSFERHVSGPRKDKTLNISRSSERGRRRPLLPFLKAENSPQTQENQAQPKSDTPAVKTPAEADIAKPAENPKVEPVSDAAAKTAN